MEIQHCSEIDEKKRRSGDEEEGFGVRFLSDDTSSQVRDKNVRYGSRKADDEVVDDDSCSNFSDMSNSEINDGPENATHAHDDFDSRKDKEVTVSPTRLLDCEEIPRPIVFMSNQKEQATIKELYDEKNRRNIKKDGITFSCSKVESTNNIMTKTYSCAMVKEVMNNPAGIWKSMPSYRGSSKIKCTPCTGMEKGYFAKNTYWFEIHNGRYHQCQLRQDGRHGSLDNRSPLRLITASPNWGINREKLQEMKNELVNCPDSWWEGLPKQGKSRRWLKGIGNPQTQEAVAFQKRIQSVMQPFLNDIRKQNPSLQYWKVGALRTAPGSRSQYEKMNSQLHADYSEEVLSRPECERPMSMIMALDDFEFMYKLDVDDEKINTLTVHGMQAIAFTNELFHAGGENKTNTHVYRLFAYIVSNRADFPNGKLFTENKSNLTKLHDKRKMERVEESNKMKSASGRNRKQTNFFIND